MIQLPALAPRIETLHDQLVADAVAEGVLFAPGSQFYSDGRPSNGLRLAFAMADEGALRRGVERLARVLVAHGANGAAAPARVPV